MKSVLIGLLTLALALPAFAQEGGMPSAADMMKMGPPSRKVTKEDTKGVDAYFAAMEAAMAKGDMNAAAALVEFPVLMATDDSAGKEMHTEVSREDWIKMMSGFSNMPEEIKKQMKYTAKNKAHFLSDTLAFVISDIKMAVGKEKANFKSVTMLTKVGDQWKAKMMAEAGWGDMSKAMGAPPPAAGAPAPASAAPGK